MTEVITNRDLVEAGIPGGSYLPSLTALGNRLLSEHSREEVLRQVRDVYEAEHTVARLPLQDDVPELKINLEADSEMEQANLEACISTMTEAARTPTVRGVAILPDACPSGPKGTITVGGVMATENAIHPGMHSADICCSMMATNLGPVDPALVMDTAFGHVRFGPLARNTPNRLTPDPQLLRSFANNPFMRAEKILHNAKVQLGTQGDGNHFYFVGVSEKTGDTYVVSHHGSRGVGSHLYKLGMKEAMKYTQCRSPETLPVNSWIEADSQVGQDYWEALQLARLWTRFNHSAVHDLIARDLGVDARDRFWNEHNFVFRRHGLYYHAKGATPAWEDFSDDHDRLGRTIIPLNMGQPVLIVKGSDSTGALGFSPHGAGRNMTRKAHKATLQGRSLEAVFAEETAHIDARFQSGRIDTSELPSAYKKAEAVVDQIERMALAQVVDRIVPHGSIMAGESDAPWKQRRQARDRLSDEG